METIFEHDVTKLEIEKITSCAPHKDFRTKEAYTKLTDIDTIYMDLYTLFTLRNEVEKAESFLKKVKEQENIIYFF
ncbi:MAG: hypothetical protein P4L35_17260 [Ignavibacteriaceae bacterium]|nr:hypothetical protein [Ignavibacteriaceae bacterium]